MKEAVEKCVSLRISTSDYKMYLSDLHADWELPEAEDGSEFPPNNETELQSILAENAQYKKDIRETKSEILLLVRQMGDLTVAVNAITENRSEETIPKMPVSTTMRAESTSIPPESVSNFAPTSSAARGVPAGLGVYKPLWSLGYNQQPLGSVPAQSTVFPTQPSVVPPLNPTLPTTGQGWPGWGQQQSTPG